MSSVDANTTWFPEDASAVAPVRNTNVFHLRNPLATVQQQRHGDADASLFAPGTLDDEGHSATSAGLSYTSVWARPGQSGTGMSATSTTASVMGGAHTPFESRPAPPSGEAQPAAPVFGCPPPPKAAVTGRSAPSAEDVNTALAELQQLQTASDEDLGFGLSVGEEPMIFTLPPPAQRRP